MRNWSIAAAQMPLYSDIYPSKQSTEIQAPSNVHWLPIISRHCRSSCRKGESRVHDNRPDGLGVCIQDSRQFRSSEPFSMSALSSSPMSEGKRMSRPTAKEMDSTFQDPQEGMNAPQCHKTGHSIIGSLRCRGNHARPERSQRVNRAHKNMPP